MPQTLSAGPVALVVDDLLLNRVLLAGALRRLGYAVVQSADGHDALRQLERREFEVVFLDWDLPGLGGDEVAALIRARPRPVPIIAITADDSAEMRARCQRAGVAGFLGKTFDFARLRAVLAALSPGSGEASQAAEACPPEAPAGRET
ncbi:MAG: response regulator, partial [Burkholderiales bacterium]|nr:response regulator [Opitutaceae bacterium]